MAGGHLGFTRPELDKPQKDLALLVKETLQELLPSMNRSMDWKSLLLQVAEFMTEEICTKSWRLEQAP
jgi:hypothetical protein